MIDEIKNRCLLCYVIRIVTFTESRHSACFEIIPCTRMIEEKRVADKRENRGEKEKKLESDIIVSDISI